MENTQGLYVANTYKTTSEVAASLMKNGNKIEKVIVMSVSMETSNNEPANANSTNCYLKVVANVPFLNKVVVNNDNELELRKVKTFTINLIEFKNILRDNENPFASKLIGILSDNTQMEFYMLSEYLFGSSMDIIVDSVDANEPLYDWYSDSATDSIEPFERFRPYVVNIGFNALNEDAIDEAAKAIEKRVAEAKAAAAKAAKSTASTTFVDRRDLIRAIFAKNAEANANANKNK